MSSIRNVVIDGRRTSMRLEPEIWSALEDAAAIEGVSVGRICALIRERRRASNLSSAVRVFTLLYSKFHRLSSALDGLGAGPEPRARLIPAVLAGAVPLERRRSGTESSCEEGLAYALDHLSAFPHPIFRQVMLCWHALRPGIGLRIPDRNDVRNRLGPLGAAAVPRNSDTQAMVVNLIDVQSENPRGFLLGETQLVNRIFAGRDISHTPVADHPFALHARAMQLDFNFVKSEAMPAFHVLRHTFEGMRRHYARLTLPLTSSGRAVDAIMTISVRLSRPSFSEPAAPGTA